MPEVTVIGARGHTGSELLPLLWRHPQFELAAVGSRSAAGKTVSDEVADLDGCDLAFSDISADNVADHLADAFVLAMPNGEAAGFANAILAAKPDAVIVDLSADFRFDDTWAYGFAERNEASIRGARLISNPGCYATGVQLALAPLQDLLAQAPVAFGVSGYSGAGVTPSRRNNSDELRDNLMPYSLAGHVHEKEVTRHLGHPVRFMPHVAQFFRGISLTVSAELNRPMTAEELLAAYQKTWGQHPLITVQAEIPEVAQIQGRHGAIVGGFTVSASSPTSIAVVCVLDNLLKGAATQAVQNLNLAFGFDSIEGIPV